MEKLTIGVGGTIIRDSRVLLPKEGDKISSSYSGLGPLTSGLGPVKGKPRQALVRYK